MKFRNKPLYHGEFFVALTIPATEHPHVVPCESKINPDGSFRLVFNVLYALGDLCFAREHAARILSEHPEWKAGIYRAQECYSLAVRKMRESAAYRIARLKQQIPDCRKCGQRPVWKGYSLCEKCQCDAIFNEVKL
jgi:hypothetical protein